MIQERGKERGEMEYTDRHTLKLAITIVNQLECPLGTMVTREITGQSLVVEKCILVGNLDNS